MAVHHAILTTHKVEIFGAHLDRLRANPQEAADIDDNRHIRAVAVYLRNRADLFVIRAVDRCSVQAKGIERQDLLVALISLGCAAPMPMPMGSWIPLPYSELEVFGRTTRRISDP